MTYTADLKIESGKKPINIGFRVDAESEEEAEAMIMRDILSTREKVDLCIQRLDEAIKLSK